MALDPEVKRQWVEDLRSNMFEQGRQMYAKDGRFCCLGVLALRSERVKLWPDGTLSAVKRSGQHTDVNGYFLQEEFGLSYEQVTSAIHWNDGMALSFPEIADRVEKYI